MVKGDPALVLLVPLERRKVGDPQKIEPRGIDELELAGEVKPQLAEARIRDRVLVGHDQEHVAVLGAERLP